MSKKKSPWSPAVQKIVDELKAKRKDDIRRLTEINKEMLELLENRREHCEYYALDSGCSACRAKNLCALRMIIDKAKGELQ